MGGRTLQVAGMLLVLWGVGSRCLASECPPRQAPATFYSENNEFAVTIGGDRLTPAPTAAPDGGTAVEVPDQRSRAYFYSADKDDQLRRITDFELVDDPGWAILSNDGRYLVTFDHRCPGKDRKAGKDAVVIYRTDGSLVRPMSVADLLTAHDIKMLGGPEEWLRSSRIDEDAQLLVLQVPGCHGGDVCWWEPKELAIHLADGSPLRPARDLLPEPKYKVALRSPPKRGGESYRPFADDPICANQRSFSQAREVPFDSLRRSATALELPAYTEVARKTRLQGSVVIEILVERGAVACVRTLKNLPMALGRAAREAALQWRFSPSPDRGGPLRSAVALDFSIADSQPEPAE
jgi:TonB family protein